MEFRATLNFRKFKVDLNLLYRIYLNFVNGYILFCLSKFCNEKKFQVHLNPKYFFRLNKLLHLFEMHFAFLNLILTFL